MAGRQQHHPTTIEDWKRSDEYHNSFLIPKDDVLDAIMKNNKDQGLPDIAVSEAQGKFLHLLVKSLGVKRILEVGTLGA
jgi:predicted O-methyltransferase YrrM